MARQSTMNLSLGSKLVKIVLTFIIALNQHAVTLTSASTIRLDKESSSADSGLEKQHFSSSSRSQHTPDSTLPNIGFYETTITTEPISRSTELFTAVRPREEQHTVGSVSLTSVEKGVHGAAPISPQENNTHIVNSGVQHGASRNNTTFDNSSTFTIQETSDTDPIQVHNLTTGWRLGHVSGIFPVPQTSKGVINGIGKGVDAPFNKTHLTTENKSLNGEQDIILDPINNQAARGNETRLNNFLENLNKKSKKNKNNFNELFSTTNSSGPPTSLNTTDTGTFIIGFNTTLNSVDPKHHNGTLPVLNQTNRVMIETSTKTPSISPPVSSDQTGRSIENVPLQVTPVETVLEAELLKSDTTRESPRETDLLNTSGSREDYSTEKDWIKRRSSGVQASAFLSAPAAVEHQLPLIELSTTSTRFDTPREIEAPVHAAYDNSTEEDEKINMTESEISYIRERNGTIEMLENLPSNIGDNLKPQQNQMNVNASSQENLTLDLDLQTKKLYRLNSDIINTGIPDTTNIISSGAEHASDKARSSKDFNRTSLVHAGLRSLVERNEATAFTAEFVERLDTETLGANNKSFLQQETMTDTLQLENAIQELTKALESSRNQPSDVPPLREQPSVSGRNMSLTTHEGINASSVFGPSNDDTVAPAFHTNHVRNSQESYLERNEESMLSLSTVSATNHLLPDTQTHSTNETVAKHDDQSSHIKRTRSSTSHTGIDPQRNSDLENTTGFSNTLNFNLGQTRPDYSSDQSLVPTMSNSEDSFSGDPDVNKSAMPNKFNQQESNLLQTVPGLPESVVSLTPSTLTPREVKPRDSGVMATRHVTNTVFSPSRPLASRLHAVEQLTARVEFEGKDSVIARLDAILREIIKEVNLTQDIGEKLRSKGIDTELGSEINVTRDISNKLKSDIFLTHDIDKAMEREVIVTPEHNENLPEMSTSSPPSPPPPTTTTTGGGSSEASNFPGGNKTPEFGPPDEKLKILLDSELDMRSLTDDIEHNQKLLELMSQRLHQNTHTNFSKVRITPFTNFTPEAVKVSRNQQSDDPVSKQTANTEDLNLAAVIDKETTHQTSQSGGHRELKYFLGYGLRSEVATTEPEVFTDDVQEIPKLIPTQDRFENNAGEFVKDLTSITDGSHGITSTDRNNKTDISTEVQRSNGSRYVQNSPSFTVQGDITVTESSKVESHDMGHRVTPPDRSIKDSLPSEPPAVRSPHDLPLSTNTGYPSSFYQHYYLPTFKPVYNKRKEYLSTGITRPYYPSDITVDETSSGQNMEYFGGISNPDQAGVESSNLDKNSFLHKYTEWQELLSHNMGASNVERRGRNPTTPTRHGQKPRFTQSSWPQLGGEGSQNQQFLENSKLNFPEMALIRDTDRVAFGFPTNDDDWSFQNGEVLGEDLRPSFSSKYFEEFEPFYRGYYDGNLDNFNPMYPQLNQPSDYNGSFEKRKKTNFLSLLKRLNSDFDNFGENKDPFSGKITPAAPLEFSNKDELPRLVKTDVSSRQDLKSRPIRKQNQHTPMEHIASSGYHVTSPRHTGDLDVIQPHNPPSPTETESRSQGDAATSPLPSRYGIRNVSHVGNNTKSQESHGMYASPKVSADKQKPHTTEHPLYIFHNDSRLSNNVEFRETNKSTEDLQLLNQSDIRLARENNTDGYFKTEGNISMEDLPHTNQSQSNGVPRPVSYQRKTPRAIQLSSPDFSFSKVLNKTRQHENRNPGEILEPQLWGGSNILPPSLHLNRTDNITGLLNGLHQYNITMEKTYGEKTLRNHYQPEKTRNAVKPQSGVNESEDRAVAQKADKLLTAEFTHSFQSALDGSNSDQMTEKNITEDLQKLQLHRTDPEYVPEISAYKAQDFSLRQPTVLDTSATTTTTTNNKNVPNTFSNNGNIGSPIISLANSENSINYSNATINNLSDNINNLTSLLAIEGGGGGEQPQAFLPPLSPLPVFPAVRPRAAMSAVLTTHFGPTKDRMIPFDLELLDLGDNYDNTSGTFICTSPGTYVIDLHLMAHPGAKVNARVHVNSRPIAALWADDNGGAGFYPSSSSHTLTHLEFGDQVYVMLVDAGYGDSWVHANYNGFSVYLLYDDLPTF